MSFFKKYFNLSKRINRTDFTKEMLIISLIVKYFPFIELGKINFSLEKIELFKMMAHLFLTMILCIFLFSRTFLISCRRISDLGISKTISIITSAALPILAAENISPTLYMIFISIILIMPGDKGENKYGSPPLKPSRLKMFFVWFSYLLLEIILLFPIIFIFLNNILKKSTNNQIYLTKIISQSALSLPFIGLIFSILMMIYMSFVFIIRTKKND